MPNKSKKQKASSPSSIAASKIGKAKQKKTLSKKGTAAKCLTNATGLPVFLVSKAETPGHWDLVKKAQAKGQPKILTRHTDKKAIRRNRYRSQAPMRKTLPQKKVPKGKDIDEYPYASSQQGGTGATVVLNLSTDNQTAGRNLGAFFKKNNISDGDSYEVRLTK